MNNSGDADMLPASEQRGRLLAIAALLAEGAPPADVGQLYFAMCSGEHSDAGTRSSGTDGGK
jgi:hypothetical protein